MPNVGRQRAYNQNQPKLHSIKVIKPRSPCKHLFPLNIVFCVVVSAYIFIITRKLDRNLNQKITKSNYKPYNLTQIQYTKSKLVKLPKYKIKLKPHDETILAVGGTDGSGTRRVVQLLTQLGVTMVVDPSMQFDVDASTVGGWPNVVLPLINHTHTLNYDPNSLPHELYLSTQKLIMRILEEIKNNSKTLMRSTKHLKQSGILKTRSGTSSANISFGFKAPISMALLPWFAHEVLNLRFLHVIRDGRDIAFSGNQSPVTKFFNVSYLRFKELLNLSSPLKAIKLWSDWNVGVYNWTKRIATVKNGVNVKVNSSFAYIRLHTEDLVSESIQVRYNAITQLAKWVGSSSDVNQICCLAKQHDYFLGSHDQKYIFNKRNKGAMNRNNKMKLLLKAKEVLASQYGKWKLKVSNDSVLANRLNEEGHEGLSVFGYLNHRDDEIKTTIKISYSEFKTCNTVTPRYCRDSMGTV